ncbi:hypothetical protein Asp14428_24730 [Actinoplanes sp. NBRC 14428]|nr:hypothetical protein Asp14428_24730 [Actinoplanes sp. NBRC 14428]
MSSGVERAAWSGVAFVPARSWPGIPCAGQNLPRPRDCRPSSGLAVGSIFETPVAVAARPVRTGRAAAGATPGAGAAHDDGTLPCCPVTPPVRVRDRIVGYGQVRPVDAVRHARESGTVPATELENQPARPSALDPAIAARLRRSADGLVAAIVREHDTGDVLMLAWMDDEALHRTLTTGRATYWSRSRREYWVKGATSGHHQYVRAVALDCDGDALLVTVDQVGAACHTGTHTCFSDDLPTSKPAETGPPVTKGAATEGAVKSGAANSGAGEGA